MASSSSFAARVLGAGGLLLTAAARGGLADVLNKQDDDHNRRQHQPHPARHADLPEVVDGEMVIEHAEIVQRHAAEQADDRQHQIERRVDAVVAMADDIARQQRQSPQKQGRRLTAEQITERLIHTVNLFFPAALQRAFAAGDELPAALAHDAAAADHQLPAQPDLLDAAAGDKAPHRARSPRG